MLVTANFVHQITFAKLALQDMTYHQELALVLIVVLIVKIALSMELALHVQNFFRLTMERV